MTNELVSKNITATALFAQNGLDPILSEIKQRVDEFTPNLETASGRKEIAGFAYKIAQSKTFIDSLGKKLVADRKAEIKLVDQERKRARDFLDAEKERVRKPLTEWEAEEARKEEDRRREMEFQLDWEEALKEDAIFNREREIQRKEEEFARQEAERKAKEEADRLEKERIANEERLKKEAAEQAKRDAEEAIRKEKERAERIEREAKEAAEKAERDRIAAEERAKLEAERIEREKKEAAERAEREKQEAIRLERERIEREAKEKKEAEDRDAARIKAEAEALAANKKHQAKINNEILSAFISYGMDEDTARTVIRIVAKNMIPHMGIMY